MKNFRASIIFIFAIVVVATIAKKTDDEEWEDFKKKHGKQYRYPEEEVKRKNLFLQVHRQIEEHNKSGKPWELGHNKFSDWTPEERERLNGRKSTGTTELAREFLAGIANRQVPTSIDYRSDPCVGPIKNQGSCGSCWAFSAIVPLEYSTSYARAVKRTSRSVMSGNSEQQLVSCACSGCNGGDYYPAWQYLNSTTTGSVTSATLAYTAKKGACKTSTKGVIKPKTWGRLPIDVQTIKTALATYGPMSMAMHVTTSFYNYKSGVYDATDCSSAYGSLNHAMAVVGYGTDATTGLDYWVIRNSWGKTFGLNGYMLVRQGVNRCGVETDVGFVTS